MFENRKLKVLASVLVSLLFLLLATATSPPEFDPKDWPLAFKCRVDDNYLIIENYEEVDFEILSINIDRYSFVVEDGIDSAIILPADNTIFIPLSSFENRWGLKIKPKNKDRSIYLNVEVVEASEQNRYQSYFINSLYY